MRKCLRCNVKMVEDLDIKAKFQNGILSLEIPKIDERKNLPEKKYIEISD